jgi:hypothetical protein
LHFRKSKNCSDLVVVEFEVVVCDGGDCCYDVGGSGGGGGN